jgi:hypothetical protein
MAPTPAATAEGTQRRPSVDAMLASRLAAFERPARPAATVRHLAVPDDWTLLQDHSAEVVALARAVSDADDWLVLDNGRVVSVPLAAE